MEFLLMSSVIFCYYGFVAPTAIDLPECEPPDYPKWGGYGPRQDFYIAGDRIHYHCDADTYIGGNFLRICEDTGDWTGEAPVCDPPAEFSSSSQTSTADHQGENGADRANDGIRGTCSLTRSGRNNHWMGTLKTRGQLIRVMVFLPREEVAYEVFMVKRDGSEISCGRKQGLVDRLQWEFHNCPEPHNRDIVAVKIKSLSSDIPLQLCEVVAHTLTDPTCVDPHVRIDNGRLELTRKTATLVCAQGFTRSPDSRLDCIRTGVWNRKSLYCLDNHEFGSAAGRRRTK